MRTTGSKITESEFRSLKRGDVYFFRDDSGDSGIREFSHFSEKNPNTSAINMDGKFNKMKDMRWLTKSEYNKYNDIDDSEKDSVGVVPCNERNSKMSLSKDSKVSRCLAVVKDDATDAAWRTAALQTVETVKTPIKAFVASQGLPDGVAGFLVQALTTPAGEATIALTMGSAIPYFPPFGKDPKFLRLSKELRVLGMTSFFNKVANVCLHPLRDKLVDILKAVPDAMTSGDDSAE